MRRHIFETLRFSRVACARPVTAGLMALSLMTLAPLALQAQTPAAPVQEPATPQEPKAQDVPDSTTQDTPAQPQPLPDLTGVPTLVPMPKEPPEVQEVEIPAKPVAVLSGDSKWEDNYATLSEAFKKINAALEKAGKKAAGRPVVVYTKYTDEGFSYQAMIPLAEAPASDAAPLGEGVGYGVVPAGKALRFIHADSYGEISETYEAAGLYIETRDLISKELQIEEWVTDITDPAAKNAIVNLYIELMDKPSGSAPPQ